MAGIDKTYLNSYEQYKQFVEWAENKYISFFNNKKVFINDHIYKLEKDDFGREIPIMNTPTYIDIYLIQNCPFDFILNRMKDVYSKKDYNELKNMNFPVNLPDNYQQNRKIIIRNIKYPNYPVFNKGFKGIKWWIQCDTLNWWYYDKWNIWVDSSLYLPYNTNTMMVKTIKSLIRQLRKMYLPSGLKFTLLGRLKEEEYEILIK